jgi:hypothetical protein
MDPKQACTRIALLLYIRRYVLIHFMIHIYRVSQEECARLRERVPYVKVYQYNPKYLYPKFNFTEILAREV